MKKLVILLLCLVSGFFMDSMTIAAQSSKGRARKVSATGSQRTVSNAKVFTVKGVTFKMVAVKGGTFTMGATSEQGSDAESDEKPTHSVTLSDYYIGETEVTQALWKAVMGSNPSYYKGSGKPVETVSWDDCQKFVQKLNSLTGARFRLPTEAEWEYAARGGNKSRGYKYSGSNSFGEVAWNIYDSDSTSPVKSKLPNELGIYDMSGNVLEWCSDRYGNYSSSSQTNPTGPSSGQNRVLRGGSWCNHAGDCRVSCRFNYYPGDRDSNLGLRLALSPEGSASTSYQPKQSDSNNSSNLSNKTFTVKGVTFKIVAVKGGTFTMGATSEQGSDANYGEKPTHSVTLSDYYIGETEVTQELWEAVMGSNPSSYEGSDKPVETVSWDDCQKFIQKLNSLTGQNFRLPTEAEWEYAARGGNKSRGYKYSGSNTLSDVAWYGGNSSNKTHPVKTKKPNELGIYDMSGNVWEWCSDRYGSYSSSSQTNPTGPSSGSGRMSRGGCWLNDAWDCRVSCRLSNYPGIRNDCLGLRLALSPEGSASTSYQPKQSDSNNSSNLSNKTFTVKGVTFKMIAVKGGTFTMGATSEQGSAASNDEKPTHSVTLSDYYIGETEVTQAMWEAVMGSNPSNYKGSDKPVESVSWDDCQTFITKLNSLTGKRFRLPTEAEWEYAARGGNKSRGYKYSGSNTLSDVAWYDGSGGAKSVKTKKPNELGIYDMSGNVWEWCSDWYGSYSSSSQSNPTGPSSGSGRVDRGGSWGSYAGYCRVSSRDYSRPGNRSNLLGLRLALSE